MNKKIKISLLVGMVFVSCALFFKTYTQHPTIAGFAKADVEQVLNITGLTYDGTVEDLIAVTQKGWLGAAQKERWEYEKIQEDKRDQLLPLFKKMGLVDAWEKHEKNYDYIFSMGATVPRMDAYIQTLQDFLKEGLKCQRIVFLSGCRYLTPAEKDFLTKRGWNDVPETEAGVYPRLFEEHQIPMDKMICIDSPQVTNPDGTTWRPGLADNIRKWLREYHPQPGTVLIISSQPFCHYQKVVAESVLPTGFIVSTVGEKASEGRAVAVYLDTLARTFHQWQAGRVAQKAGDIR